MCSPSRHGCQSGPAAAYAIPGNCASASRLLCLSRETLALEDPVLRMIRIALLALVPMIALGTLVTACSDDTTNTPTADMTVVVKDLSMPVVHDMANPTD